MFSRAFLQLFKKKPQNPVEYWTHFIYKTIQKSKKKASSQWDSHLQRPMYVSILMEEMADEMSQRLGQVVHIETIQQIEKQAQGKFDYLYQFALYCYMHEKNLGATN